MNEKDKSKSTGKISLSEILKDYPDEFILKVRKIAKLFNAQSIKVSDE